MSYVQYEPKDSDEVWEGYTWGEHRKMLAFLKTMDEDDSTMDETRERLNRIRLPRWCEFCHQPEGVPHELECRDSNDPSLWVKREARAYCYLDENYEELHTTSVPMTDEEALEYFRIVYIWYPDDPPKFIQHKPLDSDNFIPMPYFFEASAEAVIPIVRPGS